MSAKEDGIPNYWPGRAVATTERPQILGEIFSSANKKCLMSRVLRLIRARVLMTSLWVTTRISKKAVTGNAPAVVSLTTYGHRLHTVFYAIESIARGSARPQRLILWLDKETASSPLPVSLRRLCRRGLEVRVSEDFRSHKKYFPYVAEQERVFEAPLVTADDDIIYPRYWLSRLVRAHQSDTESIWSYRAHRVGTDGERILPYLEWTTCSSTAPSFRTFPTGVSGVLYPTAMQRALKQSGKRFLEVAPSADDVWLHSVAVKHGISIRQMDTKSVHFEAIRGSWQGGLVAANFAGGNDEQISKAYTADDIERIVKDEL